MSLQQLTTQVVKPYLNIEFQNGQCDGNLDITGSLTVNGTATINALSNSLIASYNNIAPTALTTGQYLNIFGNSATISSSSAPNNSILSTGAPIGKITYYAAGASTNKQFSLKNCNNTVTS